MGQNDSGANEHPHDGQPIETAGAPPAVADAAVVLLHGRGSTAQHLLTLIDEFLHHGAMYLAPQAAHRSWYPRSAFAPLEENEPWLSSGFQRIEAAIEIASDAAVPPERTLLFGFSQGGCLASEFVARTPRRYGGLIVLSGSLLGPERTRDNSGSLDEMPVFFGCGTDDPYIPAERVQDSANAFEQLDGDVQHRLYDELGHAINDDEIQTINSFIERLV
ncbi:phospholipase/carboxylesterase [Natrialba chahannaoensis JCM 10990]|uniref:Phospholipase/carboxylesterase n=1 Tax=Natrialba chahannaoensis JCM 10990 TaxID=1227492 RepID=M0AP67_9EURY|nr:dienelactone hydrolase family protein [Natrialba chahannaoensis]ELY99742.1 phospholipase/carboxylesterase [Natrialba chahannaoensis JCM 10990]